MNESVRLSDELRGAIEEGAGLCRKVRPEVSGAAPAPGKWSPREIVGHLVDSAANNHRRFVIGQIDPGVTFEDYVQDAWVAVQRYRDADWDDLITLWHAYNLHLVRIIALIPAGHRRLHELAADYVRHLRHHLGQIERLQAGAATSL
jgi:hypothetical protein